jgi:hypothetical protein
MVTNSSSRLYSFERVLAYKRKARMEIKRGNHLELLARKIGKEVAFIPHELIVSINKSG